MEIELDVGGERKRSTERVGGCVESFMTETPEFTLILTHMHAFTHLHTQHSGTLTHGRGEAKRNLLGNDNKGEKKN